MLPSIPLDALSARAPTWEDLERITLLIQENDLADSGETDYTSEELATEWRRPGFDMDQDALLITTRIPDPKTGQEVEIAVGYEEIFNEPPILHIQGDGYVHSAYRGRGIGTFMLQWLEQRARQLIPLADPEVRVSLRLGIYGSDPLGVALLTDQGYSLLRYLWRMEIALEDMPPSPIWPDGIRVETAQPGQERAIFEALEDAFRDHWGYKPWIWEQWQNSTMNTKAFDRSLWFLAMEGDQIAGVALCKEKEELGWVKQLGVRRPWRRLGLGLALLQHVFHEFYQRGYRKVGLGVDSQSLTGANRLYQRAGMHVAHEYAVYEKELRPGIEPGEMGETA